MKQKLTFFVTLLVCLELLMVGGIMYYRSRQDHRDWMKIWAKSVGQPLIEEIVRLEMAEHLDEENIQRFSDVLSAECRRVYETRKEPFLAHIAVFALDGTFLAHNDSTRIASRTTHQDLLENFGWRQPMIIRETPLYHILLPVVSSQDDSIDLATVSIGISQSMYSQVRMNVPVMLILCGVGALLSVGLTPALVQWVCVNPVNELITVGKRIVAGQIITTSHMTERHDELSRLGQVLVELSSYFQEMTAFATHIASGRLQEQQVEKRAQRDELGTALQDMLAYLHTVANVAQRISEGDLTLDIPLRAVTDEFGKTLHQMMTYLRDMANVATAISQGDLRKQLTLHSEHDVLGQAFSRMSTYLNRIADAATAIADGDLQQDVEPISEHDLLGNAFYRMALQLRESFEKIQQEVAERTKAQHALQTLNEELEDRVKERTATLEALNKELRDFAHIVSHDLKAPLRGIARLVQWLVEDYGAAFDEQGREMTDLLVGRVKHLEDLIEGILQYSRIGRTDTDETPVDLQQLVPAVIDSLAVPDHIQVSIDSPLPLVRANMTRMTQVFQNLFGNAVKFLDKPQGTITIGCENHGDSWLFRITDNGPGIDERYHDKIFDIFQTLTARDQRDSTGIGLAQVKKIVELYGGRVWVESTVGEGSIFLFTLPKTSALPRETP